MKPNIIFVFADQMRGSAMGCATEDVLTPNLDGFTQEGTRFSRAVSNTPVCGPVRASILTGLHTLSHELVNNDKALGTDVKTMAHSLNDAGYKCGYIGKWHMDSADRGVFIPPGPRRQGFDDYWAAYNCNHRYFESYYYLNDNPEPIWMDGYEPFGQTGIAIDYLEEKSGQDDPFCLFLSFGPPHCPYREVPQKYIDMYPEEKIELRPNAAENADKSIIAGYYAHITALDECMGRLLDAIEKKGLAENTIVIFSSDHGDMLFSQNRGWKCKPWAESIIVPFIARWPGRISEGHVSGRLMSHVDLMPTLLSLAGAEIPIGVQGKDMSGVWTGNDEDLQESVFINYPLSPKKFSFDSWRGVVTERYTYARFKEKPWVLYDDAKDPYQLNNLIESKEHKGILVKMDDLLEDWLEKLDDLFESSDEVCRKYYSGAIDGIIPFYDNDKIKTGKEKRRKIRLGH